MTRVVSTGSIERLPVRLTSFVGRVAELQEVGRELERHRLVTLVGPGGSGKTRLALEAARAWTSGPRWFADLAPIDSEGVDAALAVATDAPEGPGETPLDAVIRRIGQATGLLLLDNCDQVVAGCAHAVDALLRACPGLTVLATSREPLRAEGECTWRLPPLSLPSDRETLDGDAVLLFLDRAGLPPDVAVRDSAAIRDICRHVDGMPLAIELAAARAAVLPVPDILAGLADRFRLLTGGRRTADPRERSLAESIRWSYRLLDPDEQTVLQRLGVFRGAFGTDAARTVAAGDSIEEASVLPLLANLVEKSFVAIDERADRRSYRLLETIRDYAGRRLAEQPQDKRATRTRHLRYLRDAAERLGPLIEEATPARDWPEHFQTDLADLAAAIAWAAENGYPDDALRVVGSLHWFWFIRARGEDRRLIDVALAIAGGQPSLRARALSAATRAALARLDPAALEIGREAVRLAEESGDPRASALAHTALGFAYIYLDVTQARPLLLRACELARAANDRRCLAAALESLADTEWRDPSAVRERLDEALALAIADGNELVAGHARVGLSVVGMTQGRFDDARQHAREALRTSAAVGSRVGAILAVICLGTVAVLQGDDDAAREHAAVAAGLARASGNPLLVGTAALTGGLRSYANGDLQDARPALATGIPVIVAGGVWAPLYDQWLTDADIRAGDIAAAREHAAHAAEVAEQTDTDWGRARAALAQVLVDLHDGAIDAATKAAHRALELAQPSDDHAHTVIDGLELLAGIAARRRSPVTATRLLAAAAAARPRITYARFRLHVAEHDALRDELRQALGAEEFTRVWAEGERLSLANAVALARTRRGSRRRPTTGWDALTPAELRVVTLVGQGLNNPEIAERLYVSRETIKAHVAAAFRKLGVANRAELAATAATRSTGRQRSAAGITSTNPEFDQISVQRRADGWRRARR